MRLWAHARRGQHALHERLHTRPESHNAFSRRRVCIVALFWSKRQAACHPLRSLPKRCQIQVRDGLKQCSARKPAKLAWSAVGVPIKLSGMASCTPFSALGATA